MTVTESKPLTHDYHCAVCYRTTTAGTGSLSKIFPYVGGDRRLCLDCEYDLCRDIPLCGDYRLCLDCEYNLSMCRDLATAVGVWIANNKSLKKNYAMKILICTWSTSKGWNGEWQTGNVTVSLIDASWSGCRAVLCISI